MPKHTSRRSRRLNPTDWFGYSVADEIKVTVVHTPITQVRDVSGKQVRGWKPLGLWYACGGEWIEWVETNVPEWLEDGQYLYEVQPNYSVGGLAAGHPRYADYVGGVLRLSTEEEVVEFSRTYSNFDKVDWHTVALIWDGIEICPYQDDLRLSMHGWYYPWDVASGCIWRPSGLASPLVLLKSRESASVSPRRGVDRGNPRRRPLRRNGLLGSLALAGAAGAVGYHLGKRSLAPRSIEPLIKPRTRVVPLDKDDGYEELRRLQAERALKGRMKIPFTLPPKRNPTFRLASDEDVAAARNRFYDALEAEAGEGQTYYFGPFVVIGDQKGGVLGKLELNVWQGMPNGGLAVSLSYIGVNKDERQRGQGARLMQIVLAAADAAGLPVTLTVSPQKEYGEKKPPMNKKDLRAFYEKFGFRTDRARGIDAMVRPVPPRANPRRKNPSSEDAQAAFEVALEAAAGEGQVRYAPPLTLVGDGHGGWLGKLEVYVDQGRLNDDALSVHLHFIGVSPDQRQQGRGARLMQIVLAAADAVGLPVTLEVSPEQVRGEKKPPMNKKQLRAFYEKFGFVWGRFDRMVRPVPPRANPRAASRKPAGATVTVGANKPHTLPPVGANIVVRIPDGRNDVPMTVEDVVEVFEEGDGGIWEVSGRTLSAGRYGYGPEARQYREGAKIAVSITYGDKWQTMKEAPADK